MHPVESSATLSREFSYKQVTVERVQLQRNYPVKSSSIQTSYPIEITCKHHLQTSNPEESSAIDKSLYSLYSVQLQVSHSVENSATSKPLCREFSYHQVTP